MWKQILLGLTGVLLALAAIVAVQSPDFKITRETVVQAPAEAVFAQVNDFHLWQAWSPWAKMDPQAKNVFSGPPSGRGATFSWDGNNQVGAGTMVISDSQPPSRILIQLEFSKPFAGSNIAEFTFVPEGPEATKVTWTMTGRRNFLTGFICLFLNMDKMVGGEFEKGLAQIKSIVEAGKSK